MKPPLINIHVCTITCEVAEETEGEGEAGGVSRLQGKFRVT